MAARGKLVSTLWRQTSVAVALACVFAASQAQANGTVPTVVSGQVGFSTLGGSLNITNSPGAIINWQGFSIGAGETTRFIQQSSASSVLNRVIGSDPSVILGTLISNGRIFLINPSGILFGQGSRIDVSGLVASTLNLSNPDFLAGRLNFASNPLAGKVENQGSITTPSGGSVYLVGSNVTNSGIINSPQGDVILAAGQSVNIFDSSTPGVRVEITASDNAAVNLGEILAQSGEIGIYGAALRNAGIINADQVGRDASGTIVLRAKQDVTLETGSRITANGEQGGEITIQSETGTTLVSGMIEAKATGDVAGNGGTVQLLGNQVGLVKASVDVSGMTGGGTVLIGGDLHGANTAVQNASATYISADSTITADAIANGSGGKVIVWSDDTTRYYGNISARGGVQRGNGGFTEVSGKKNLVFGGYVNLRAPNGRAGTLLLDPYNLTIQAAAPDVNGDGTAGDDLNAAVNAPNIFFADYPGQNSIITTGQVVAQLSTANITLQATNDITVAATIDAGANVANKALTLQAGHDVIVNAALTSNNGGSLILLAGHDVNVGAALTASGSGTAIELSAGHDVIVGAGLTANGVGGSVILSAGNAGTGPGVASGTVTLGALVTAAADISIRFNPVNYTTTSAEINTYLTGGDVSYGGAFDARAWVFVNNLSATAQSKTYDGTTAATLNTPFTFLSEPDGSAGQAVSLSAGAATFNFKDVSTATTVNFTGYGLVGGDVGSYALFSQPASQAAHITQKSVTIAGTAANDKIYNGDTLATLSNIGTVATGVGTETLVLNGPLTANINFNSKDVASASLVTGTGYSISDGTLGGLASNYALSSTTSTAAAHITQKSVTIAGTAANDKIYNGDTLATLSNIGTVATGVGTETLVLNGPLTANINFNSKDVASASLVTGTGYSISDGTLGGLASNYALSSTTSTAAAHITQKSVTIAGTAANDKIYNGDTLATLSNIGTVATGVGTETLVLNGPLPANINFDSKDVASASLVTGTGYSISDGTLGGLASNYALSSTASTAAAHITQKSVTIAGTAANDKIYNGDTLATLSNIGTVATGVGTETLVLNGPLPANINFNSKDVASASLVTGTGYSISDGTLGGLASNYALSSTTSTAAAHITQKSVTIAGTAANDKIYNGDTLATLSNIGTVATGVGTETLTLNGPLPANINFDSKDVASASLVTGTGYSISDGTLGGLASNYALSSTASTAAAHITQKSVTIAGTAANDKIYNGDTLATLSNIGTVATGVGTETLVLNGPLPANINFDSKDVASASLVTGTGYSISDGTLGGLASNYALSSTTSTAAAHITQKSVTIAGTAANDKIYNGDTLATLSNIGTVATGVGTETLVLNGPLTANINFNSKDVASASLVTGTGYSISDGTLGGLASNYALSSTTSTAAAHITQKSVTIAGTAANDKIYNGDTLATLSNIGTVATGVGTETLVLNGPLPANINFNSKDVASASLVTGTGYSISDGTLGGLASNYALSSTTSTAAAHITQKSVTIAGTAANDKIYNGDTLATLSNIGTVATGVGTETLTLNGPLPANINFDSKDVASASLVTGTGYSISDGTLGGLASNYALSSTTSTAAAHITPAALTIAADALLKVYGTADPSLTYTTGVFQFGDTAASVLSGALSRAVGEHVGSYAISQNTLASNANYTVAYTGNSLSITPAALNVAANSQSKLFGTSDPALTFSVTGLVNNPALGIADTASNVLSGALTRVPDESALGGPYAITQGSLAANSNYTLSFTHNNLIIIGAAAEPILGFNAEQVIFAGVINNEFYYSPGNFWHISLNSDNADPGFDVMRGTNDLDSHSIRSLNGCDGGLCETWSFPQQFEKALKK